MILTRLAKFVVVPAAVAGAVAAVLWLTAGSAPSTPARAASTITVYVGAGGTHYSNTSMTNNCGSPCITNIDPGDTVHWLWQGSTHSTTSDAGSTQVWDSGEHGTGNTFDQTFNTPGTYAYHCTVHSSMHGRIVVGAAATPTDTPPVPPTAPPPTNTPAATPTPMSTSPATSVPTNTVTATPTASRTPTATRSATPLATTSSGRTGDVNCSGAADAIDAALVLQFDAGLVHSLSCQPNGDVSGDGLINSLDAALILQYTAGLIGHLPL